MSLADDRILEFIRENESGSPSEMKNEGRIRYTRQHIARRCRKLAEYELLKHLGNGVYIITDDGEAYLDGKLDTQTMQYLNQEGEEHASNGEGVNS